MIVKVNNCEYYKLDKWNLKENSFMLYLQCTSAVYNTKDIYEFKTDNSKVYVSAKTVLKMFIPDMSSLDQSIEELIQRNLEEHETNLKFVYVSYFYSMTFLLCLFDTYNK